ncbi:MAG: hypothetical protein EZS28_029543 [Streblomastix strix]|uniref:Uncharacterized protein n=1 Tax=Streblomastix strix TaxID=222440 RepID=A0A5J4UXL6_9EUKA|nr:MAG: hypothetical protein EZS28_029543 [Streblomastix strix]
MCNRGRQATKFYGCLFFIEADDTWTTNGTATVADSVTSSSYSPAELSLNQNIDAETTSPSSVYVMGYIDPTSGPQYTCLSLSIASSGEINQYSIGSVSNSLPIATAPFTNKIFSDEITTNLFSMALIDDIEWNTELKYERTYTETQIHIPFGKVAISPSDTLSSTCIVLRPKITGLSTEYI